MQYILPDDGNGVENAGDRKQEAHAAKNARDYVDLILLRDAFLSWRMGT